MSGKRSIANIVILGTVTLQALPFFAHGWIYPFIDYPMYSAAAPPGPCFAARSEVILHSRSGHREQFLPQAGQELSRSVAIQGLSQTTYQRNFLFPLIEDCRHERGAELAQQLGERINRGRDDPVLQIELRTGMYRLDDGRLDRIENHTCLYRIRVVADE